MCSEKYKCRVCGEGERIEGTNPCYEDLCCNCCKKIGLQHDWCKLAVLELELIKEGKELNENEEKGIALESAISNTLDNLGIPHKHNPFRLYYSNYQGENPDIIIEELNAIVECKNLSEFSVSLLSEAWLNENIIDRPKTSGYNLKMALFSYKPRNLLVDYLKSKGWRTYGLGFQILDEKQEKRL